MNRIEECSKCELCKKRHKIVWGEGSEQADVLFIGEAPGAQENMQGTPFVGRAGSILNNLLDMIDLTREEVYITNIVKCRPPNNRKPTKEEAEACRAYLDEQILHINPKLIVCLGQIAATNLLGLTKDMGTFTNSMWNYKGFTVVVAYHPASVFYQPSKFSKLEYQFKLIRDILSGKTKTSTTKQTSSITEEPDLGKMRLLDETILAVRLLKNMNYGGIIAFDTETTGIDYNRNHIIGFSIAYRSDHDGIYSSYYVPIRHKNGSNVDWEAVKPYLQKVLENKDVGKVFHHAKFDMHMLDNEGLTVNNFEDTLLLTYCINENIPNKELKTLACRYIDPRANYYEAQLTKLRRKIGIEKECDKSDIPNNSFIPVEEMYKYACNDAVITLKLYLYLKDRLAETGKEKGEVYIQCVNKTYTREKELLPVLKDMEAEGIAIDLKYFSNTSAELIKEMADLKVILTDIAGEKFNINSPKQVGKILVDKLGYTPVKMTMTRQPIVDDATLVEYYNCEWTQALRKYRALGKLVNTYILPIILKSDKGLLRTTLHQHRANNGRLSSSDPNLQNIPIRVRRTLGIDEGMLIRKGLINWGDEWKMLFADYSQIELRTGASYANIANMIKAFDSHKDIHTMTSELVYRKKDISPDERYFGKTLNFLALYGGGVRPIVSRLMKDEVPLPEGYSDYYQLANDLLVSFHRAYPEVRIFTRFAERKATEKGWIKNHFGRMRRFQDNNEWTAFQYVASSTAADIIKNAMLKIHKYLYNKKSKMVLQIHDELIFKMHKSEEHIIVPAIRELMYYDGLKVPIPVDMKTSTTNWIETK